MSGDTKRIVDPGGPDFPIDASLLQAIGLVTVTFAALEDEWSYVISSLLAESDLLHRGSDEEARRAWRQQRAGGVLSAVLSFGRKLEVATTLVAERFGPESTQLDQAHALAKRSSAVEEERNRVIHASWAPGESPGASFRAKFRAGGKRGLIFTFEEVNREALVELARRAFDLAYDVDSLRQKLYPSVTPTERPSEQS